MVSNIILRFGTVAVLGVLAQDSWGGRATWDPPAVKDFPDHLDLVKSPRATIAIGERLFRTKFNIADGAGRPAATGDSKPTLRPPENAESFIRTSGPDANSCFGCHNDPTTGGSGDFAANVFVGAHFKDPPTTSIVTEVTSERNTIGIFGAGAVELLAREMTRDLKLQQQDALAKAKIRGADVPVSLSTKGVSFGEIVARPDGTFDASRLEGADPDLVIKPFGAKGVVISLREFTINALNQHHGIQAIERFGWERTGRHDFDEDEVEIEFTIGQVSALTVFQASLPAPRSRKPSSGAERETLAHGYHLFADVGCAECHRPTLVLSSAVFTEPNQYNRPGNLLPDDVSAPISIELDVHPAGGGLSVSGSGLVVAAYTDLKRHSICDTDDPFFCNERLRQDNVPTDQFITPKLWDLATSAPYGHRGDCTTVSDAILHHAGEAAASRRAFSALSDDDKRAMVAFLLSLGSTAVDETDKGVKL